MDKFSNIFDELFAELDSITGGKSKIEGNNAVDISEDNSVQSKVEIPFEDAAETVKDAELSSSEQIRATIRDAILMEEKNSFAEDNKPVDDVEFSLPAKLFGTDGDFYADLLKEAENGNVYAQHITAYCYL